jgi:hypothetical protein
MTAHRPREIHKILDDGDDDDDSPVRLRIPNRFMQILQPASLRLLSRALAALSFLNCTFRFKWIFSLVKAVFSSSSSRAIRLLLSGLVLLYYHVSMSS